MHQCRRSDKCPTYKKTNKRVRTFVCAGHATEFGDGGYMSKGVKPLWVALLVCFPIGQALAQGIWIEPARVISVVSSDWNDDGWMDRAVIYDDGKDDAALAIYFSDSYGEWRMVGFDPDNAWFGGWGQQPELLLAESGDLHVRSMNIGTGRNRWQMDITLAFDGVRFVVQTYKYKGYDSLNLEDSGTCEVDYLTGTGRAQRAEAPMQPFSFFAQKIALGEWTFEDVPEACQ